MSDLTEEDEDAIRILLERKEHLTDWETSFLESLGEQGWMSGKQREVFDRIWDDVVVSRRRG